MERVLVYDGDCGFCTGIAGFIGRRDKKNIFRFLTLQSEDGGKLLSAAGLKESDRGTVVYRKGARYFFRSSAVLHILKDLGGFWNLFFVFILVPPFIRDAVYRFVARHRRNFSRFLSFNK